MVLFLTHLFAAIATLLFQAISKGRMTSALASQLGSLRSLNAQRLTTSAQNRQSTAPTSYLFSSRDAARQDLRSVHAIATNGWQQILLLQPHLAEWASSTTDGIHAVDALFGDGSLRCDRTMLDKEENAKLDALIKLWFDRMGPFLLDEDTSKCIEWLVRRFR